MEMWLRHGTLLAVALAMVVALTMALDPALKEKLRMRHNNANNDIAKCGMISKSQLTLLDRVCEDCHMMFRIQNLHSRCRSVSNVYHDFKLFLTAHHCLAL